MIRFASIYLRNACGIAARPTFVGLAICALVTLGGCTLWFGGDGDDVPPVCLDQPASGGPRADIAPAPLRDPGDLTCDDYGGGPYCDPSCGACPEATNFAPTPPIPSYNYCGHICESYGEGQCSSDPQCRVVKHADCVLGPNNCLTDFMGCFPTDTQQDVSIDCWNADAWSCSRNNQCSALHDTSAPCEGEDPYNCPHEFVLCMPEGENPGGCEQTVACDRAPPICPSGTTPGVRDLCYTGACIPNEYCTVSI